MNSNDRLVIGLPSGIGDISWAISKLINAPEWDGLEIEIADGWPYRAEPYLKMLGVKCSYGQFEYRDILNFVARHPYKNWSDITRSGYGKYLIEPNQHLERGFPLSEWLPDLSVNYHYPMNIPDISHKKFFSMLTDPKVRYVGISAASYRGATAWKTWELDSWTELCNRIIARGYNILLMGGRWDDLTEALSEELPEDCSLNIVGKTDFSEACAVHKLIPFYVGFSSGLGIIRSVMGLPTIMLWPSHQVPLSTSWADPEDIETKKYIAFQYVEPRVIYKQFAAQEKIYA